MKLAFLALTALALAAAELRNRRLLGALGLSRQGWRRLLPDLAALAALALLLWPAAPPPPEPEVGPALALAVDLSASMAARDIAPDRLTRAKAEIRALAAALPQGRFALLPFAGEATLQVPLTRDREALLFFVDRLEPGGVDAPGSAPEEAILAARTALAGAAGERAVVLFSDGERTLAAPPPPLPPGIPVFVVPLGSEEGSPLLDDGEPRRGTDGSPLLTRLDRGRLERIAATTGGELLEPGRLLERWAPASPRAESGGGRGAAILATLLLALRQTPSLRRYWPLALLLSLAACEQGVEGRSHFAEGMREHGAGRPEAAADLFARAASHLEGDARAAALHNRGTSLLAAGDPLGALAPLEEALLLCPGDEDIRINLALALRALGEEAPGVGSGAQGDREGDGGMDRQQALQLLESVRPDAGAATATARTARSRSVERNW